jgi:WD40 repeat protein/DNA-binding SARP family transcriptional activator/energy-coupling factor transporter ATP-binding protein EcfA2
MEFRILGPLEVRDERGVVALGGTKPRAVLVVLLLHQNEPVSADKMAEALWGEDAPKGAAKTVQVHVSRLRKALGNGDLVAHTPAGYCLRVRPGELDAERFNDLVEDGRRELAEGHPERAASVLREALVMWRGPPFPELALEPFAPPEMAELEERRLAALELRIDADLAAGRAAELVGELQHLVAEHPARERLAGQLMLALYRSGRQTDALNVYRDVRRALVEFGVDQPGRELRDLHEAILHQDPSLEHRPSEASDLPPQLDATTAPPLEGRSAELAWLRARWEEARGGAGALIAIVGQRGIGKSRLLAEMAGEVHASDGAILSASGAGPADAILQAAAAVRSAARPTLLVVDDADRAGTGVLTALEALEPTAAGLPVLGLLGAEDSEPLAAIGVECVTLGPLDAAAVGAIALRYAPSHAIEAVPAEALLRESDGVPLRVHELAGAWAQREAAHKVGATAKRTAAGRAGLRDIETELASGVFDLQAADAQVAMFRGDDDAQVVCPFKGLASFEAADAEYFFGREKLIAQLVAKLVGAPLLGVVGPSGSGKSSAVRAGLLPALADGVLPGSESWGSVIVRPGEHPLAELEHAVTGIRRDQQMVLAVDQFEETFTTCRDEDERSEFIAALVGGAQDPHVRAVVVIVVRADYYGRCAAYPELSSLLAANNVLVRSMRRDELRRAIELPAQRAGLRVEPELTDALVAETENEPGSLPLLSTALLELWQRRRGRRLRHADYEHTGGVRGAVARLAEEAFERLDADRQLVARNVFTRLTGEGADGTVERRRVAQAELESDGNEDVPRVVSLLTDQRLLTASEGTVEVAHEALLREWPRLRGWIEEDREGLRIHRRLTAAAQEWDRVDRDADALYRGSRLTEALEWRTRREPTLNPLERAFLDASAARRQRDRASRRHRIELAFGALAVVLAAITVVAIVAVRQRNDAQREREVAVSRELALQSANTLDANPELALKLADWAVDTSPTAPAVAALREATLSFRQLADFPADPLTAETAAYSPDGTHIVTGGDAGIASVWDVRTHRRTGRLAPGYGSLYAARYSPKGDRIALGFKDGTLVVASPSLAAPRELLRVPGSKVQSVAFTRDGERIAAAFGDGTVRVVPSDGQRPPVTLTGHRRPALGVDISADGNRVVSAGEDGSVRLWNTVTGRTVLVLRQGGAKETDVRFSPDGRHVLAVGTDRVITLWNAATGARERRMTAGTRELLSAAFSPDGRRFAVSGYDGVIRIWSIAGGPPVAELRGQRSRVTDLGFGATGDRLVSAGADGTVSIWDAGRTAAWRVPGIPNSVDLSPDGKLIASAGDDGIVRLWEPDTGKLHKSLRGPAGYTLGLWAPTSDRIVISSDAGSRVLVWPISANTAQVAAQLPKGRGMNVALFDDSGRRIVYADTGRTVAVHDLRSGREIRLGGVREPIWDVHFSPDGRRVAAATERGTLMVWRLDRPSRPERVFTGHRGHINVLDYGANGRIATAGADRTVRVWNPRTRASVVLRGHTDEVTSAIFTNDGAHVLSTSDDSTLRLWDARGGEALAVLQSGGGPLWEVSLSRDGTIATYAKSGVVRVFKCEVCGSLQQLRALARSRAPQPLTPEERQRFLAAAG